MTGDGLSLFFGSSRSGGQGNGDIWVTTRTSKHASWSMPVNLGAPINSPYSEWSPFISSDGLTLLFGSCRPGGFGSSDIWMVTRKTINGQWSQPVNLGPNVNTLFGESHPTLSHDGSTLFIGVSGRPYWQRQGKDGLSNWDVWSVPILSEPLGQ